MIVGVTVGVIVGVTVGVLVGVKVGVLVGVAVGVRVGVLVGVSVGVRVGVIVTVLVGVAVGVIGVGVQEGPGSKFSGFPTFEAGSENTVDTGRSKKIARRYRKLVLIFIVYIGHHIIRA